MNHKRQSPILPSPALLCDTAGIDIKAKAIWRDRAQILAQLAPGELRNWLKTTTGLSVPAHSTDIDQLPVSPDAKLLKTLDGE